MRNYLLAFIFIILFIITSTASSLLFRVASQHTGRPALLYFILGNLCGFGVSVSLTLALHWGHANMVYAMAFGGAFCILQVVSWLMFKEPLTTIQWTGVGLVAAGMFLLPLK